MHSKINKKIKKKLFAWTKQTQGEFFN